jgi:hypothetical protein
MFMIVTYPWPVASAHVELTGPQRLDSAEIGQRDAAEVTIEQRARHLEALALRGTIRIMAAVARHPKVPAGWNAAAWRSLTRRCYRAGRGAMSGDQAELPGPRDGLGPVGRAELAQDVGHVLFDRVQRHHQVVGDALV